MATLTEGLQEKTNGLIYYSDADNPFTTEPLESKSIDDVITEIARLNDADISRIKTVKAEDFFQQIQDAADPNDAVVVANAKKAEELHSFLKENLSNLTVYRVENGVRIPVYIAGFAQDNACVALKTLSVES